MKICRLQEWSVEDVRGYSERCPSADSPKAIQDTFNRLQLPYLRGEGLQLWRFRGAAMSSPSSCLTSLLNEAPT